MLFNELASFVRQQNPLKSIIPPSFFFPLPQSTLGFLCVSEVKEINSSNCGRHSDPIHSGGPLSRGTKAYLGPLGRSVHRPLIDARRTWSKWRKNRKSSLSGRSCPPTFVVDGKRHSGKCLTRVAVLTQMTPPFPPPRASDLSMA